MPTPGLTSGSISYNAGLTLSAASEAPISKAFSGEFSRVGPDQAPLRYVILYYFLFLGRDEFIIRLPSLLFGVGSLLLIYYLGKLMFGVRVGLVSALLLSLSLSHIHHSSYVENYTLYAFLALASVFCFCKSLRDKSISMQIAFIASSTLGFYAFYPFITLIMVEFLYYVFSIKKSKSSWKLFLFSLCSMVLLIFPGLIRAYEGLQWKKGFGDYSWGWGLSQIAPSFFSMFGGLRSFIPINIFIFLLGLSLILWRRKERRNGLLLFSLVALPSLFLLSSIFLKTNIVARYFFFIYPFFIIISSYGIVHVRNKMAIFVLLCLFSSSSILFVLNAYGLDLDRYIPDDYVRHYADFRFPAEYLRENYERGDVVVIEQGPGILATQYYLDKANDAPVEIVRPSCEAPSYYRYSGNCVGKFFGLVERDHTPRRFQKLLRDHSRLWLIDLYHIFYEDQHGVIQAWIDENYSAKKEFKGGVIYLFDNQLEENQANDEIYECGDMICFLECDGETEAIVYPFQERAEFAVAGEETVVNEKQR